MTELLPALSQLCGWVYFTLWACSAYPQPFLNFKNRSTAGLAFDYPVLNLLGFVCYTIGTVLFLYSSKIREQYAARHPASPGPPVRFNDLCFGVNATVCCTVTVSQFWPQLWRWERLANRRANQVTWIIICASLLAISTSAIIVLARLQNQWEWIDVIYTATLVKLVVTVSKCSSQIMFNYRRKSTQGWSMIQVFLDFGGGVFSFLQLIIDSYLQADWSGLYGNPVKLGLANITMFVDLAYMLQHFVFYRHAKVDPGAEPRRVEDDETATPTETDSLLYR